MMTALTDAGVAKPLNPEIRPTAILFVQIGGCGTGESRTFICSADEEDAGPTNHWAERTKCAPP